MGIVIERIAGPFITKVTYPDLNYQLELHSKGAVMTPEELSAIAQRAYEIMAANTGESAPWGKAHKTPWLDAVRSHEQYPEAIQRKSEPNLQERCIAQAYREAYAPVAKQPLVIPADEKKGKNK